MSVDAPGTLSDRSLLRLDDEENAALAALATELCGTAPHLIDSAEWVAAARRLSCALPPRLSRTLREFTHDSGPDGMLLLRNLPVDPDGPPATPMVFGSVQRASTVPASALMLVAMAMGEVIAYDKEKHGALVQNVVPVPGMEEYQGNAGSARLNMHTENAFHEFRPDFVGLMCLRNDHDNVAGLRTSSIRNALPLLPEPIRAILHEPRFVTTAPASFDLGDRLEEPHGVLSGAAEDPDLKVDFSSTTPIDDEAAGALARLRDAIDEAAYTLILSPGDLAFVDNRVTLHGRNSFQPRYDGADRWLQRVFVHLDLRRSRALRGANGQVLSSTPA
ncbi:TauD/TfdA family dioxygenase [Dactylosporangium sp. CA-052675]|uniref:TauD/TfdA family dioxygenase n=1 Tax=Dactylosporangium sp. CA-052675 TaxID=3239927 RepID=UPI003D90294E